MSFFAKKKTALLFTVDIQRPLSEVFDHLSTPHNYLGLQPLLVDISDFEESQDGLVTVRSYTTVEKFLFAKLFTYYNRIRVLLRLTNPPFRLDAHVDSPAGVTLDVEYHFSEENSVTHLREIVMVESFAFLNDFVIREANQAQSEMLSRLKERLEARKEIPQ